MAAADVRFGRAALQQQWQRQQQGASCRHLRPPARPPARVPSMQTPQPPVSSALPPPSPPPSGRGDCRAAVASNKIFAIGGVESFLPSPNFDCGAGDNWLQCYRFLKSVEVRMYSCCTVQLMYSEAPVAAEAVFSWGSGTADGRPVLGRTPPHPPTDAAAHPAVRARPPLPLQTLDPKSQTPNPKPQPPDAGLGPRQAHVVAACQP